jgi:hypothetical protein
MLWLYECRYKNYIISLEQALAQAERASVDFGVVSGQLTRCRALIQSQNAEIVELQLALGRSQDEEREQSSRIERLQASNDRFAAQLTVIRSEYDQLYTVHSQCRRSGTSTVNRNSPSQSKRTSRCVSPYCSPISAVQLPSQEPPVPVHTEVPVPLPVSQVSSDSLAAKYFPRTV